MIDSLYNVQNIEILHKYLDIIRKNALLLLFLIFDILDYSRSLNSKINLNIE